MSDKLKWDGEYYLSMVCSKCDEAVGNMQLKADIVIGLTWNDQDEKTIELGCDDWTYQNVRLECSCGIVIREDESDLFSFEDKEDYWIVKVKKSSDSDDTK